MRGTNNKEYAIAVRTSDFLRTFCERQGDPERIVLNFVSGMTQSHHTFSMMELWEDPMLVKGFVKAAALMGNELNIDCADKPALTYRHPSFGGMTDERMNLTKEGIEHYVDFIWNNAV